MKPQSPPPSTPPSSAPSSSTPPAPAQPTSAQPAPAGVSKPAAAAPTAPTAPPAAAPVPAAPSSRAALLNPALATETAPEKYKAKFSTTKGDFVIEVTRAWAPLGADRFYNLVKNGFYDDTGFFRNVPQFVVQFGLSGDPKVNAVWKGANIKDDPVSQSNTKSTVTFATAGPNTRTTQVFINFVDNKRLDGMGFAPFGVVAEGMNVVESLTSEYGQRPGQDQITLRGNAYLKSTFPNLDFVKTAEILK